MCGVFLGLPWGLARGEFLCRSLKAKNEEGRTGARPRGITNGQRLEHQFQSKLDLARRAEVAGWEPSALNGAERLAGYGENRVAKVRMV